VYHPQLLSHIAIHLIYLQYPSVQLLFILGTLLAPLVDILWVPPRGSRVAAEVLINSRGDRRCNGDKPPVSQPPLSKDTPVLTTRSFLAGASRCGASRAAPVRCVVNSSPAAGYSLRRDPQGVLLRECVHCAGPLDRVWPRKHVTESRSRSGGSLERGPYAPFG